MPRPQASIDDLRKDLAATSTVLSDRSRTMALGIVGIWWSAQWGTSGGSLAQEIGGSLKWPAFLSIAVLILDFLQYVAGYGETYRVHRAAEKAGKAGAAFDPDALLYRARSWFFVGKIVVLGVAALWLAVVVGAHLSG